MEQDKLVAINRRILDAAYQAAGGLSVSAIERFLRTGEETWDAGGRLGSYRSTRSGWLGVNTRRDSDPSNPQIFAGDRQDPEFAMITSVRYLYPDGHWTYEGDRTNG
jgi:hypothetical protein